MCFGSDASKPPNPEKVSADDYKYKLQGAQETMKMNAIDRLGPLGDVQWVFDPNTGMPIGQRMTLTPEQQARLDAETGAQTGISQKAMQMLGMMPDEAFSFNGNRDDIAKASFEKQMAMLAPEWEKIQGDMLQSWNERGIPLGDELYAREQGRFDDERNQAMFMASRQALLDAGNELQREFNNALTTYNNPMDQFRGLMSTSRQTPLPDFAPQAQTSVGNVDHSGNVWNSYNAKVAQAQADNANLFGLASTALMFL